MATAKKTKIEKIENALRKHNADPGISVNALANLARVSRSTVYKRVHDLRESYKIVSNYRTVKGKKTLFYRFASR